MERTLAIIGYGGMGQWHGRQIREKLPGIHVKGAYDVRHEMLEKAQADGLYPYPSLEAVLRDPQVDMVTIATPNNFHRDIAIACLQAGKHVICEKPVTLTPEELEEIMAVAEKTGRLFTVHQNRRWDKDFRMIKALAEGGAIGKPYAIESRVLGSRRVLHGWRGHKFNGGGMVYDWGVHLFDQLLWLVDSPVVQVFAQTRSIFTQEVDDNFKAMLLFENGLSALVEVATNCFVSLPRFHMCCTDGTVLIDKWGEAGRVIKLSSDEIPAWDDEIVYTTAGPTRTMAPLPREALEELPLPQVEADWKCFYENVLDALAGRAELIVKPQEALRVLRLIQCVFESAKTGASVACRI